MRAQEFLNDSELQEMPLPADWDPEIWIQKKIMHGMGN